MQDRPTGASFSREIRHSDGAVKVSESDSEDATLVQTAVYNWHNLPRLQQCETKNGNTQTCSLGYLLKCLLWVVQLRRVPGGLFGVLSLVRGLCAMSLLIRMAGLKSLKRLLTDYLVCSELNLDIFHFPA